MPRPPLRRGTRVSDSYSMQVAPAAATTTKQAMSPQLALGGVFYARALRRKDADPFALKRNAREILGQIMAMTVTESLEEVASSGRYLSGGPRALSRRGGGRAPARLRAIAWPGPRPACTPSPFRRNQ